MRWHFFRHTGASSPGCWPKVCQRTCTPILGHSQTKCQSSTSLLVFNQHQELRIACQLTKNTSSGSHMHLQGTASTLTRAEVRGGGKKPYAQKGSGNARQGSIRTPLKPGGGVVFGPKVGNLSQHVRCCCQALARKHLTCSQHGMGCCRASQGRNVNHCNRC